MSDISLIDGRNDRWQSCRKDPENRSTYFLIRKLIGRHSPWLGQYFYEHMPASRVCELVGENIWRSYYTLCFERNPWDKVVSYYLWKAFGQNRKMPSFEDYVMTRTRRLPVDAKLYFYNDELLVDNVYEFRDLQVAVDDIRDRTGAPIVWPLPREKTDIKMDRRPYSAYYTEKTRNRVAELFQREIALMDYRFDQGRVTK
jgi:hypothetical protein